MTEDIEVKVQWDDNDWHLTDPVVVACNTATQWTSSQSTDTGSLFYLSVCGETDKESPE